MKLAYLEDAEQERVNERIRSLLQEKGALIGEHTSSHLRFEGLNPGEEYSFSKGGYVGTYQHVGEDEVELRLKMEATLPSKIFWRTVVVEMLVGIGFFILNPPSSTWIAAAALMYFMFIATFLLYLGTWRSTRSLEKELFAEMLEHLQESAEAATEVELEEERLLREFKEDLEAEIAKEALKQKKRGGKPRKARKKARDKPAKGDKPKRKRPSLPKPALPRFGRKKADTPTSPEIEAKRQRLAELRAAVAARRKAAAEGDDGTEEDKRQRIEALRREIERRKREAARKEPETEAEP